MDIKKELLNGKGYAIDIENMNLLNELQSSFIKKINISNDNKKDINFVRKK